MRRRILLADDSVTIQKVIELTFLDEDYEVKAVSNGDEALAVLAQVDPDFVIADVHMPGANGYEVCRRVKELKQNVPVLLLVGTFEPFDEGQSRSVGADSFLKKPFDSQELLQRVEELLSSRAAAAPAAAAFSAPVSPFAPAFASPGASAEPGLLDMDGLSELPPLDLGPAPSTPFASAPTPEPFGAPQSDWGSFAPAPRSSFDESAFALTEETAAGDSLRVDEGALLPAGEPMFEMEDTSLDLPGDDLPGDLSGALPGGLPDDLPGEFADAGLRGGEFGDATPGLETPSFDSFETPSFGASSYDSPAYEAPSYEPPPSYSTPSFGGSVFDAPAEPAPFEAPVFDTPVFGTEPRGFDEPAFQAPIEPLDFEAGSETGLEASFETTPEERLGVPQGAEPLVESLAETESRIEAPPPPSIEMSHEPASTLSAEAFSAPIPAPVHAAPAGAPLAVGAAVPASTNGDGRLSDEDVDRIARRVVELIGDKAVRDVAWEVIPDLAEVVIRDRLRDLESQAESFE
jgi:CheY-like chemotaxis protein